MSPFAFPALFAFLVNLGIGLYVLGFGRGRLMDRLFGLLILIISVWNLGDLIMLNAVSSDVAGIGARLGSSSIAVPIVYFLFASAMSDWSQRKNRFYTWLVFSLPGIIFFGIVLTFFQNFFEIQYIDTFGVYYYSLAQGHDAIAYHLLLFSFGISYISGGIIRLSSALKVTRQRRIRRQIRLVLVLTICFAILSLIISLSLLAAGDWGLVSMSMQAARDWALVLGLFTRLILSGLLAATLLRYRIRDLFRLAEKGFILSFLTAAVMAVYVLVIKELGETLGHVAGEQSVLVESALIVALVFAFHPLRILIERWVDRFILGSRPDLKALFMEYSSNIQNVDNLKELALKTTACLNQGLHVQNSKMLLYNEKENRFYDVFNELNKLTLMLDQGLENFDPARGEVDSEYVRYTALEDDRDGHSATTQRPTDLFLIRRRDSVEGMLALFRYSSKPLLQTEQEFITALCDAVATSITTIRALDELEARNRLLRQSEKLAALGELSAGFAHEIRNPLNVISGAAQTIGSSGENADIRLELSRYIREEVNRLNDILSDFLKFAKPSPPQKQIMDISTILEEAGMMIKAECAKKNIDLQVIASPSPASVDPAQIKQVLLNLLLNAVNATPEHGTIIMEVRRCEDIIHIRVSDTGCGMSESTVEKIFDPFFTTRPDGTGLGMSVVHRIIKDHAGSVKINSTPGHGTGVHIALNAEGDVCRE